MMDKSHPITPTEAMWLISGWPRLSYPVQIDNPSGGPPWWVEGPEREYYWNVGNECTVFKDARGWRCVYHWIVVDHQWVRDPMELT